MINNVTLTGRLVKEPELKEVGDNKVLESSIAVNRNYKKNGVSEADFFNIVAWNKTAELMASTLTKGSLIGINGRLQNDTYNKDGKNYTITKIKINEISFLEKRKEKEDYFSNDLKDKYSSILQEEGNEDLPF